MTAKVTPKPSLAKPESKKNTYVKSPENKPPIAKPLTVVGVGTSAGGLEAFTQLLRNLPADTGMAFVLVQHLDPNHESMLTQLLSQRTKMPVNIGQDLWEKEGSEQGGIKNIGGQKSCAITVDAESRTMTWGTPKHHQQNL